MHVNIENSQIAQKVFLLHHCELIVFIRNQLLTTSLIDSGRGTHDSRVVPALRMDCVDPFCLMLRFCPCLPHLFYNLVHSPASLSQPQWGPSFSYWSSPINSRLGLQYLLSLNELTESHMFGCYILLLSPKSVLPICEPWMKIF